MTQTHTDLGPSIEKIVRHAVDQNGLITNGSSTDGLYSSFLADVLYIQPDDLPEEAEGVPNLLMSYADRLTLLSVMMGITPVRVSETVRETRKTSVRFVDPANKRSLGLLKRIDMYSGDIRNGSVQTSLNDVASRIQRMYETRHRMDISGLPTYTQAVNQTGAFGPVVKRFGEEVTNRKVIAAARKRKRRAPNMPQEMRIAMPCLRRFGTAYGLK